METAIPVVEAYESSYGAIIHKQPGFTDQAADDTRRGVITSAAGMVYGLGSDTSISGNVPNVRSYTEHEALTRTLFMLGEAMTHPEVSADIALRAKDVYEHLSFIGEKELVEAALSIAEYWKAYLNDNPDNALFIVTSTTFKSVDTEYEDEEAQESDLGYISDTKSDTYILDAILSNFNDEDLQKYSDRLLVSAPELIEQNVKNTKVIVLDDWIMSGRQMRETLDVLFEHVAPVDLEINLIVCSEDRLEKGFVHDRVADSIPVKAHFVAQNADHPYASEYGGTYLTAAHSSGDYPFEETMDTIVDALNRVPAKEEEVFMPPLANIIRPYYAPDYHPEHIERLHSLRAMGRSALIGVL